MKLANWIVIIISILIVAAIIFSINLWAREWKDLFFYLDDWRMWVILIVIVYLIKKILEKLLIAEVRLLK